MARDDDTYQAPHRADLRRLLLQMLLPPVLAAHRADNALLALEHAFERQCAEMESHCNVRRPAQLSLYGFTSRVAQFSELAGKERGGAGNRVI